MEFNGSDNEGVDDIPRRRRWRDPDPYNKADAGAHDNFCLKLCEEFFGSWFLTGACFAVVGLACIVVVTQNLKLDICNSVLWIAYAFCTLSVILGITLIAKSLAKCLRFIIKERQLVVELESIPSQFSLENPAEGSVHHQPVSVPPEAPRQEIGPMKVYAEVHRAQGSSDSMENSSLCNFMESRVSEDADRYNTQRVTEDQPGTSNSVLQSTRNGSNNESCYIVSNEA